MLRELYKAIGLGILLTWGPLLRAQTLEQTVPSLGDLSDLEMNGESGVLYDAKTIGFDKDGRRYLFEGDVVLIGGGYVITADTVEVEYFKKELVAKGHVLFINNNQIFTGDRVFIRWETGDFTIDEAMLVANDSKQVTEAARRILGQSPEELAYESARQARLAELGKRKGELREQFRKGKDDSPSPELLATYTRLLEQEQLTLSSQAPNQAERNAEKRRRYDRRRGFWEKARAEAAKNQLPETYYFRIQGETISRRDGFLYEAEEATFTPCRCEEDETPAWGFQAETITAQEEGYIDLKHPVLMIKGLPVLYFPFMKLPLKAKRQSGFLMPSFQSGEQKNGFVYTQPVFLDFAPNADATVTTDLFEKRGTRLGFETRYEARRNSGFQLQWETIRDRSWLELINQRKDLLQYHLLDQPYCTQIDPIARQICEQQVRDNLQAPSNTWRGKQEWRGRYILAPRLSLVSEGKIISDHRYVEDLYLPEDIVTAFANQANATAFSRAKAKLSFDGPDWMASLGNSFGDNALNPDRYAGQQLPLQFHLTTRYFRLLPASWISIPIYGSFEARALRIEQWNRSDQDPRDVKDVSLGSGTWQRYGLQLTTPVSSEGIIRVDHFADGEVRVVEHQGLSEENSVVRSWKTGLTLNLPIDGTGPLPAFLQWGEGQTFVQHKMNWGLSLSIRPVVVRDGPYGDLKSADNAPLVYFPSDRKVFFTENRDIRDEDMMVPHQRLTLSTNHRWQLFDRVWETVAGQLPEPSTKDALDDLQEEARRELMSVRDRPVRQIGEIFRENKSGQTDWFINRYRQAEANRREPVNFTASMSYDHQQEILRQQQIDRNAELEAQARATGDPAAAASIRVQKVNYFNLPESWLGPYASLGLNWQGFALNSQVVYNMYKKTATTLSYDLGLPSIYSTNLGFRYVLEKSPELDVKTDDLLFKKTRTTTLGISTTLIPYIYVGANLIRKQVEEEKVQYGTSYQIAYDDLSGCWGLRFVREKDLNQEEKDANYILQLAVIFLGNRRGGDISPGIERDLGLDTSRQ